MNLDDIKDKARCLKELRDRADTVHEAEAAARAFARLVEKYRLDEAELEASGASPAEACVVDPDPLFAWTRTTLWRQNLGYVLGTHHGVVIYRHRRTEYDPVKRRGVTTASLRMVGRPGDIAVVRYMWGWLSSEIARLCDSICKGKGRLFRSSWCTGFVRGLHEQMIAGRAAERATATATSAAMVLVDSRLEEANACVALAFPRMKTVKSRSYFGSFDAYEQGRAKGKRLHLGTELGPAQRALPEKSTTT